MGTVHLLMVGLLSAQVAGSPGAPQPAVVSPEDGPPAAALPAAALPADGSPADGSPAAASPTGVSPAAGSQLAEQPQEAAAPPADSARETTTPEPDHLVPVRPLRRDAASDLIEASLRPPTQESLAGMEVTLYQILMGPVGQAERAALIRRYWQLSAAVADYHNALAALRRLQQLPQSAVEPAETAAGDQLKLELATSQVRVAASRLVAVRAQHRLIELRPDLGLAALPLPDDAPHTGGYRTLYDQIFAGKTVPAARRLHAILPLARDLVVTRAAAVAAADRLLTTATDRLKSGHGTVDDVLDYNQRLVDQQQALVAAVRDYNLAIAEYAQLVAPLGSDPARLVAMLIKMDDEPAKPLPAAAGTTPGAAGGQPPATRGLRAEADGMMSVLRRPPVPGAAPAAAQGGSGVVQANAEEPIDDGTPPRAAAESSGGDGSVPQRFQRGP